MKKRNKVILVVSFLLISFVSIMYISNNKSYGSLDEELSKIITNFVDNDKLIFSTIVTVMDSDSEIIWQGS